MVARGVRSRALRAHPSYRLCSALVRYDDHRQRKLVLSLLVAVGAVATSSSLCSYFDPYRYVMQLRDEFLRPCTHKSR
jgi:hypothetical protein